MHKIFLGFDHRQTVSITALIQSLIANSKEPIAITPLVLPTLPIKRQDLTPFTWSRFLVPHLCDYKGTGLFLDADMMVRGDISEVFRLADTGKAAYVMQEQPSFEWSSMILFNCGHEANKMLTPEHIETVRALHKLNWLARQDIGSIPKEWNVCVPYGNNVPAEPKLVHYTQGVPHWWETRNQPFKDEWLGYAKASVEATHSWFDLMGRSVHADPVVQRLIETGEVKDVDDYARRAGLVKRAAE